LLAVLCEFVLLSEGIADDPGERRFIVAALAIRPYGRVEPILKHLEEIGVSISPERVIEFQRDPIFLRLHRGRTRRDDTYPIEELKEYFEDVS
jgi:hypothetical protein